MCLPLLQAELGHLEVVNPGQQADHDIVLAHQAGEFVASSTLTGRPAVGVAGDQFLGLADRARGDGDLSALCAPADNGLQAG